MIRAYKMAVRVISWNPEIMVQNIDLVSGSSMFDRIELYEYFTF